MSAERADLATLLSPPDMTDQIAALGSEPRSCLLCAGASFERLFQRFGKWYWRCPACKLVFVHDIYPEFVRDTSRLDGSRAGPQQGMVSEGYDFETLRVAEPRLLRKFRRFLHALERHRRLSRLLEVGCGQGLFLEHAARAGWEVEGVELLPPLAELARRRGLAVFSGELAQAGLGAGSFDVVSMSEVIEHVIDPVSLMKDVARVLRPGGVAILGTGNAQSWAARLRAGNWPYYRFGGHLHIRFYSPESAKALARASGFASVTSRTHGFAFCEAAEMRGRWYKPLLKLAQLPLSPLASAAGAGHRLVMTLHAAGESGARRP